MIVYPKRRIIFHLCILYFFSVSGIAQLPKPIIGDEKLLAQIKDGLDYIYGYKFKDAKKVLDILLAERPDHPTTSFFKGLIVYWEEYPLTFTNPKQDIFIQSLEESIERARPMWENDENSLEGVFFDLMSRAMLMMYYADNGASGRVIKMAPKAYSHTLKSFELCKVFNEYYFITGLYNYYIEAYPEKNPVYKPVALLFKNGNKQEGLKQLQFAIDSTVFMRNEAATFLSIIYFDFEKDTEKAIEIMQKLHGKYPDNPFFISYYIEYLLLNEEYEKCIKLNQEMVKKHRKNGYIVMKGIIFKALIEEKFNHNYDKAYDNFKTGIKLAEDYGSPAKDFLSYAYFGLGRIEAIRGNEKISHEYFRKAKSLSRYNHFSE